VVGFTPAGVALRHRRIARVLPAAHGIHHDLGQYGNIACPQVETLPGDRVQGVDGITDTKISRDTGTPEELIIVDRQKAADMKLTVSKIASMLQTVLTGTAAGNYREAGNEYKIRVKLQAAEDAFK
jgi:hypothetical protein